MTVDVSPSCAVMANPGLQGVKRRVLYVTLYELIAMVAATLGLAMLSGQGMAHSGVVAVAASVIAVRAAGASALAVTP